LNKIFRAYKKQQAILPKQQMNDVKIEISERVSELITSLGFENKAQFANAIGVTKGTVSLVTRGERAVGASFLAKLKQKFPEVNLDWLLSGTGEVFNKPDMVMEPNPPYKTIQEEIEALEAKTSTDRYIVIEALKQENALLKHNAQQMLDIIEQLSKLPKKE
jgi:transcriptional regulator with XRE-family HTH domain